METLSIIQVLSKIGKIFSKISYIFCLVGAVGCVIGIACLPFANTGVLGVLKIGGVTIYNLIVDRAGIELDSLYPLMTGAMIVCIGEAITSKFAERYFAHELTEGTPFTLNGAKELLRLGILTICVPLGTLILAQIVSGVIAEFVGCGEAFKLPDSDSVALGVMFIFMSLLCQYGAESREENKEDLH